MASAIKAISGLSGRKSLDAGAESDDSQSSDKNAKKYVLRVAAGPSYDASTHHPVYVNTDEPCVFENEFVRVKVKVRIRGYHGLPKGSKEHSSYFDDPMHAKDQYSIAFSFVPKQDLPSKDTVWGNDFDHPVRDRLPPGFNTAFKIVKEFIDPGLSCDAYADQPWLYGPSLSCWFALRVGDEVGGTEADFPAPDVVREGADGSGERVRQALKLPDSSEKRRKFFLDARNREPFVFEKGRCYQGDFFNPYLDFGKFALKLPGFSLGVIKYINDKTHHLRYVFKDRGTGQVYFCVVFTLLFGDDLQEAQQAEKAGHEPGYEPATPAPEPERNDGAVGGASSSGGTREPKSVERDAVGGASSLDDTTEPKRIERNAGPSTAPSTNRQVVDQPSLDGANELERVERDAGPGTVPSVTRQFDDIHVPSPRPSEPPTPKNLQPSTSGVDEIADMLKQTSTADGTGKSGGWLT